MKVKKQVANYLSSYENCCLPTLQVALATICVCSCKHDSSWVASYIYACTNEAHSIANLQTLIPTFNPYFGSNDHRQHKLQK